MAALEVDGEIVGKLEVAGEGDCLRPQRHFARPATWNLIPISRLDLC